MPAGNFDSECEYGRELEYGRDDGRDNVRAACLDLNDQGTSLRVRTMPAIVPQHCRNSRRGTRLLHVSEPFLRVTAFLTLIETAERALCVLALGVLCGVSGSLPWLPYKRCQLC